MQNRSAEDIPLLKSAPMEVASQRHAENESALAKLLPTIVEI